MGKNMDNSNIIQNGDFSVEMQSLIQNLQQLNSVTARLRASISVIDTNIRLTESCWDDKAAKLIRSNNHTDAIELREIMSRLTLRGQELSQIIGNYGFAEASAKSALEALPDSIFE